VAAIILALLIILLIIYLVRRRRRQDWESQARAASAEATGLLDSVNRGLATLQDPSAAARTWSDVEARGSRLHRRLDSLTARPPDHRLGVAVEHADQALQALRASVQSDSGLRLGPPSPTPDQLRYSEAVIRQRTTDFEQAMRDLDDLIRPEP
jgi:hypothetical protein